MSSLDKIVRSFLLSRGLPIHYYIQALLWARDCLRELTFDDMKVVQYALLTLDQYNNADLPCDFMDDVTVGIRVGQLKRPLVKDSRLNTLPDYDSNGNRITYTSDSTLSGVNITAVTNNTYAGTGWVGASFNELGEYIGRNYGYKPTYSDTYNIDRTGKKLVVNEQYDVKQVLLEYISDGTNCNAASKVDPYAIKTIDSYIEWYMDEKGKCGTAGEAKFIKERRILRGRLSDITLENIKRSIQESYGYK